MKNKLQKYDRYKDSGVEWLGEIPDHWECIRMKHLYRDVSTKNRPEAELLSVTQTQGVVPRKLVENRMVMPSGALGSFKFIHKGDFAISLRSFEGGLEYCHHDGIISPAYTVLKAQRNFVSQFYKYLFKSISFISELQTSIVGIREGKNISYAQLSYSFLPIPLKDEQIAIANYLDDKTTKIDQAIAIKEKQIALLKERRQILIHKAVTRGLNPDVKLKDSGVEWIGEIPEGWEVKRLASFGKFSKGGGFSKSDLIESGVSAILYGDIYTKYDIQIKIGLRFISSDTAKKSIEIKKGNLLFTGSGETREDIGKCVVFLSDEKTVAGGDVIIFEQNQNDNLYLSYVLNTESVKYEKAKYSKGEIIVHTYGSKLRNIYIPIPSKQEQTIISEYVENTSQKNDTAISLKKKEIEKLKEYKSSLINSVVTGKIKVC